MWCVDYGHYFASAFDYKQVENTLLFLGHSGFGCVYANDVLGFSADFSKEMSASSREDDAVTR